MESSHRRGPGQNKRFWTEEEDKKLIEALLELHDGGEFAADGNFKPGHLKTLERLLLVKLPYCDLKAKPHIESRMKTLKTHFNIVHDMLTRINTGFNWDMERKTVRAPKPVWDAYLQRNRKARPLRNKAFPYYDELCKIFGKNHVTVKHSETPLEIEKAGANEDVEGEYFNIIENARDNLDNSPTSLSFSQTSHKQSAHSCESSRKKRKSTTSMDLREAIKDAALIIAREISESYNSLSRAISQEVITGKQVGLNEELTRTTNLNMPERHRATLLIGESSARTNIFYSIPPKEREVWVRALLKTSI